MNQTDSKRPFRCEECEGSCIKNIAFLQGIPEDKQAEIMLRSVHKCYDRDDAVFREGDPVNSVFIIKHGQVKLVTFDAEGREKIVGIFSDADTVWEGIFVEGSRYPYSCVCLTPATLCCIRRSDVENAVSNPQVALRVISMLSLKLHDANERNMILSVNEPVARIAAFLIYCERRSSDPVIKLRLDDIAGSVGLRPETVSRYIRRMVNDGLIEKVGQSGIRITDFAAMQLLVNS